MDIHRASVFTSYTHQRITRILDGREGEVCTRELQETEINYLSSIRHLFSLTLQCALKSSNNLMHFLSCWHTDNAWLHVGNASIGYGSFSVKTWEEKWSVFLKKFSFRYIFSRRGKIGSNRIIQNSNATCVCVYEKRDKKKDELRHETRCEEAGG